MTFAHSVSLSTLALILSLTAGCATLPPTPVSPPAAPTVAAPAPVLDQATLDRLGDHLGYRWEIVDNRQACDKAACFLSALTLTLPEGSDLPGGWTLYLSYVGAFVRSESEAFDLKQVNGDLYALTPKAGAALKGGASHTVRVWGQGHFYARGLVMPNAYVAAPGLTPRTLMASKAVIDPESGLETLPFVAPMTDEAKLGTQAPGDKTQWLTPERAYERNAARNVALTRPAVVILPTPARVTLQKGAPLDLSKGFDLRLKGLSRDAITAAVEALKQAGAGEGRGPVLSVTIDPKLRPEAYRLTVGKSVSIRAGSTTGANHALRSLAQQTAFDGAQVRRMTIEDAPRLPFRGLHIDVARNFHSKAFVLETLEQMAAYKLNRLHLHLGDDEGWRLEIDGLPELTQVGAYRCHDPAEETCLLPQLGAGPERDTPVNGYFSKADYIDILKAAQARGIEVIPSFDMPGHSRAAIKSMEVRYRRLMAAGDVVAAAQYRLVEPEDTTAYRSIQHYNDNTLNVCLPATYAFIDKVIDETMKLHQAAGVPLKRYHIGADETAGAWTQSPACQAFMAQNGLKAPQLTPYFIERVSAYLAQKGIETAGWSDGMGHTDPARMPKVVQSNIWSSTLGTAATEAHDQANRGWEVVLSVPDVTYFDMPPAPDSDETAYDWASRDTDSYKIFSFQPENLPANASLLTDIRGQGTTVADNTPYAPGRGLTGLQGQLWSEVVRTDDEAEYRLFPRLLPLAERAWHRAGWEVPYKAGESYTYGDGKVDPKAVLGDWQGFRDRLGVHLRLLDQAGIAYRLAPPGAKIEGGQLFANAEIAATPIQYRLAGGEWTPYTGPVAVSRPVELRVTSPDGRRKSRMVRVE
ncbi:family 20 glycosylhydrolase [Asticcacaulis sp. W401b]|uniref:family 20 glycosylhydrolase n=1 Tax=Asticcacaulis sp. W401b TaxID=3388666 RepID=UPI0039705F4B